MADSAIDFSDAPAAKTAASRRVYLGRFYRPVKEQISVRVDADVLAWLRSRDKRYQTYMNDVLRRAIAGEELRTTGLVAGLEELADEFANRGLKVELVTVEVEDEPELSVAEALREASREALTNAAKHARVSRVVVRAVSARDGVEVTIRDQGAGFDSSAPKNGFGIDNSIIRRMAEVGGKAEISSTPGRGTRIALWAPRQSA